MFVKSPNYRKLGASQYAPENFFPAEPSDIYNEAAFPHELNFGLAEFPLSKKISATDRSSQRRSTTGGENTRQPAQETKTDQHTHTTA